jgi:hypothetical protein
VTLLDALLGPLFTSLGEAYAADRAQTLTGGRDSRGYEKGPPPPPRRPPVLTVLRGGK